MNDHRFEPGRVAIVTGAAGGLGSAVVEQLAGAGVTVVAVDLEPSRAEHPNVHPVAADLAVWAECERVVADAVAAHGRLDILVNCAAVLRRLEFDEIDEESFAQIFAINTRAVFVLCREAVRAMEQNGYGRIVNVTSVGVHVGGYSITSAVYESTKGAVAVFSKTLATHCASLGILVNCVAPGGMRTRMLTAETPAELLVEVEADIPLKRLAEPDEVATAVCYLASDVNTYATGATFDVNGGVVMP